MAKTNPRINVFIGDHWVTLGAFDVAPGFLDVLLIESRIARSITVMDLHEAAEPFYQWLVGKLVGHR